MCSCQFIKGIFGDKEEEIVITDAKSLLEAIEKQTGKAEQFRIEGKTEAILTVAGQTIEVTGESTFITTNPDSESPAAIIAEIASYFTAGSCPYVAITDRKEAIEHALSISQTGDIILLAGKGHETYQLICGVRESFSEAEIIKEYCRSFEKISN
jgi:UDP-N-acetylmuramyl tripeptide synthase